MILSQYFELLEYIKTGQYKKVLVTGPQRSGTTHLSRILSQDLSFELHDELKDLESFKNIPVHTVSQGPSLCHLLHTIEEPEAVVVFVSRSCKDIIASQKRIKLKDKTGALVPWSEHPSCEHHEKYQYKAYLPDYYQEDIPSCYIKQNAWLSYQMPNMKVDYVTFPYDGLMSDNRYVQKEHRVNFGGKQTA